jgi:hypothetical protein
VPVILLAVAYLLDFGVVPTDPTEPTTDSTP